MTRGFVRGIARVLLAVLAASVSTARIAQAQNATCTVAITPVVVASLTPLQNACVQAQDLFAFIAPQVGVALAGGNVMPGEGGTLGGWGKRSAVLRITAVDGRIPSNPVNLGSSSIDFGAQRAAVPVPTLSGAIGIFRGLPLGLTNVGGVDALVGVTVLPNVANDEFSFRTQKGGISATFGARVGVLQESLVIPGIAVSWMQRRLPRADLRYTTGADSSGVTGMSVTARSLRLTANKRFGVFGIGLGVGEDEVQGTGVVDVVLNQRVGTTATRGTATVDARTERSTRGTAFVNVSLGLPVAQFVLELGQSNAGKLQETTSQFGARTANEGYRYGSVAFGIRF
jgi:hypothetical protein